MVVIDLGHLFGRQHRAVNQLQVIGEECQRLKGEELTEILGFLGLNDQQQILGADAVLARLVQARLIAGDHARQQLDIHQIGTDALRSLMASQEMSHTMASAVAIGHGLLPQWQARKHVELAASGAAGEFGTLQGKMTLENEREVMLLLSRGIAQGDCTGDVGCTVKVLRAAIHEQNALTMQGGSALVGCLIVDDSAMLFVTTYHGKAILMIESLLGAEFHTLVPHVHLVDGACGCRFLNPLEQAHQCGAVTLHGTAEALDLHIILEALEVGDG